MTAVSTSQDLTVTVTTHLGGMQWRQINSQLSNVYYVIFLLKREQERAHSSQNLSVGESIHTEMRKNKKAYLPTWLVELTQLLPILAHIWQCGDVDFKSRCMTCGTGICCGGDRDVWEHEVLKSCSKIRYLVHKKYRLHKRKQLLPLRKRGYCGTVPI